MIYDLRRRIGQSRVFRLHMIRTSSFFLRSGIVQQLLHRPACRLDFRLRKMSNYDLSFLQIRATAVAAICTECRVGDAGFCGSAERESEVAGD